MVARPIAIIRELTPVIPTILPTKQRETIVARSLTLIVLPIVALGRVSKGPA